MGFSRKHAASLVVGSAMAVVSLVGPQAWAQSAQANGEVRRVDAPAGTVTLKHDAIAILELPAMTLVYQAEPAMLAPLKPGDKVRFTATRKDGKYIVTEISK